MIPIDFWASFEPWPSAIMHAETSCSLRGSAEYLRAMPNKRIDLLHVARRNHGVGRFGRGLERGQVASEQKKHLYVSGGPIQAGHDRGWMQTVRLRDEGRRTT